MKLLGIVFGLSMLFYISPVFAQLSGGSYEIYGDTFSFVSTGYSTGGSFALFDSGGEFFAATSTGGDYALRGGFRSVEKGVLRLSLSSSTLSLGELSVSSVSVATTTVTVETDNANGYSLAIRQDGAFMNGDSDDIDSVGDAEVTAGSEEYGFGVFGDDATLSVDTGMNTFYTTFATKAGTISGNQTDVGFKASISSSTPVGAYSHTVQFLATVNL